jgi:hypothetical protein
MVWAAVVPPEDQENLHEQHLLFAIYLLILSKLLTYKIK